MLPSSISKINLDGRNFYVKRDDLIDPFLAGNKYRKFYSLLNTPMTKYKKIISYGGTQSNAMLALAALAKKKAWDFVYYTKPISTTQSEQKEGNFYEAKSLGMEHVVIENDYYKSFVASLEIGLDEETLLLNQGGADALAKDGLEVLAQEIRNEGLSTKSIAIPSGTGTTALYLALSLPEYTIYTTAVIGSKEYLIKQMQALHKLPNNLVILEQDKKHHFSKLYEEYLHLYQKLLSRGIAFDLLYAPLMWKLVLEKTEGDLIYIHTGGVSGNKTMLARYYKKFK